jgi:hypothetical protein
MKELKKYIHINIEFRQIYKIWNALAFLGIKNNLKIFENYLFHKGICFLFGISHVTTPIPLQTFAVCRLRHWVVLQ